MLKTEIIEVNFIDPKAVQTKKFQNCSNKEVASYCDESYQYSNTFMIAFFNRESGWIFFSVIRSAAIT